jgi:uncharacterized membrane protein YhaH (DUF805 family)
MNWFLIALKKYATFSGRSQRAEYWYYTLFYILIYIGLTIIDSVTGTFDAEAGVGLLGSLMGLALLIPTLAVTVRRLHDTGRSGWWLLIGLIPLVGLIVMLVFTVQDSKPGDNEYGPNPKGVVA